MAYLFITEGRLVVPHTETILISPFKDIWDRDSHPDKAVALEELAYVEFMSSMKKTNPYRQYPEDKKHDAIKDSIITIADWEPDSLIQQGIEKIRQFQKEASVTYNYYMAAKVAAEQMQDFFLTFDINEMNVKTGNPIYKPKDITNALKDTEDVLTKLNNLKDKVEQELFEETKNKANKEISPFANPDSLH